MNKLLRGVTVAALLAAPTLALAQDEDTPAVNNGNVHVEAGVEFTNAYYFRGIIQVDKGVVAQPWAQAVVDIPASDTVALTANAGIWSSFHSSHPLPGMTNDAWYEADLYAGLGAEINHFSLGVAYTFYTSPANYFSTIQEIAFTASYDDSHLWADRSGDLAFALNPAIVYAVELDNTAFGPDEGMYFQFGVEPTVSVTAGNVPLSISLPIAVGFSIDDYYELAGDDDVFGFGTVGIAVGADITESILPAEYGTVSVSGKLSYLFLGDNLSTANGDEDSELIGTVGLTWSY